MNSECSPPPTAGGRQRIHYTTPFDKERQPERIFQGAARRMPGGPIFLHSHFTRIRSTAAASGVTFTVRYVV